MPRKSYITIQNETYRDPKECQYYVYREEKWRTLGRCVVGRKTIAEIKAAPRVHQRGCCQLFKRWEGP